MNKIKRLLKSRYAPRTTIYLLLFLVIAGLCIADRYWPSEISLNLLAESIGVGFTVLVIDVLISLEERRRSLPARYAAFRQAWRLYGRFTNLWICMLKDSYDTTIHREILEANNSDIFRNPLSKIVSSLDLTKVAPVTPKRDWRTFIFSSVVDLENEIAKCLQRYSVFMEPEMIAVMQDIEGSTFIGFCKLLPVLPISDAEMGLTGRNRFSWAVVDDDDRDILVKMKKLGMMLRKMQNDFSYHYENPARIEVTHAEFLSHLASRAA